MPGSILGKGLAFPFGFTGTQADSNRSVAWASDEDVVRQSILVIMGWALRTRVMRRAFGCDLKAHVFDPANSDFDGILEHVIRDALGRWEKRAVIGPITFNRDKLSQGRIDITGTYQVIKTQQFGNFVYPYYLNNFKSTQ